MFKIYNKEAATAINVESVALYCLTSNKLAL